MSHCDRYVKCTGEGSEETDEINKKMIVGDAFTDRGNNILN